MCHLLRRRSRAQPSIRSSLLRHNSAPKMHFLNIPTSAWDRQRCRLNTQTTHLARSTPTHVHRSHSQAMPRQRRRAKGEGEGTEGRIVQLQAQKQSQKRESSSCCSHSCSECHHTQARKAHTGGNLVVFRRQGSVYSSGLSPRCCSRSVVCIAMISSSATWPPSQYIPENA